MSGDIDVETTCFWVEANGLIFEKWVFVSDVGVEAHLDIIKVVETMLRDTIEDNHVAWFQTIVEQLTESSLVIEVACVGVFQTNAEEVRW